ncbi:MAG: Undecaprenyl-phosphate mannosyltransferase [Mycobacterium sp.]|nr:Undecaprenyl-phosphate mannosyltransferase [Mycobacterium sp.]
MTSLCIIPTYNEAETITDVIQAVLVATPTTHVLVVDDGSPDGTAGLVLGLMESDLRVRLLQRTSKSGLGSAYRAGFAWGLERDYQVFVEMDADLSHDPADLPALLAATKTADLVIGSRYVPGGRTIGWSRFRKLISRTGNAYVQRALGMPLSDATAGYRAFRRELLVDLPVSALTSSGYCFQIETAYLAWRHGFRVVEMPVTFRDRTAGSSKMSGRIVVEALAQVTRWGLSARWDPEPAATARIPVQINVARHDAPEPAYSQQLDGSTA